MKTIQAYEEAIENGTKDLSGAGINRRMYLAYRHSKKAGAADLNFDDLLWDTDVDHIVQTCRRECIERITISSSFSDVMGVLWAFLQKGCTIEGMKNVPTINFQYNDETCVSEQVYAPAIIIRINREGAAVKHQILSYLLSHLELKYGSLTAPEKYHVYNEDIGEEEILSIPEVVNLIEQVDEDYDEMTGKA